MFNIGTAEVVVIALIALIVLGPDKLPQAARQVGHFTSEARKIANGFRQEMKNAMDEVADTSPSAEPNGDRTGARRLTEPPHDARPIDVEPAKAEPLSPPPGVARPAPVRPDDPSSN
jgi:sec-independent protein translocase protein TatB